MNIMIIHTCMYVPLGSFLKKYLIFSSTAHFLQDFPFKWHLNSFPHSNAQATYVDLAVK